MIEHRVGTSRRSGVVHVGAKLTIGPIMRWTPMGGAAFKLAPYIERGAGMLPRLSHTVHKPITGRHWRGELVTPLDGATTEGAILYLHGGAFIFCGLGTHRRIVERLAQRTGMAVLSVEYRQLPVGGLEDSIADSADAYSWLVKAGFPAHKIVIAGDSAGGFLTFATALRLRDKGLPRPAALVGISPLLDWDHRPKLLHHNSRRDAYIPARRIKRLGEMVVGRTPDPEHSPVNADLTGLPPTLLLCAESEVLRVDSELMTERLHAAGVPCTLQIWEGQVHAFPVLGHLTPETRASISEIVGFVKAAVGAASYGGQYTRVSASERARQRFGVA